MTTYRPPKLCIDCRRRPAMERNRCRQCLAQARVAMKRSKRGNRADRLDWQRPIETTERER